jgi:hypothetical protein
MTKYSLRSNSVEKKYKIAGAEFNWERTSMWTVGGMCVSLELLYEPDSMFAQHNYEVIIIIIIFV